MPAAFFLEEQMTFHPVAILGRLPEKIESHSLSVTAVTVEMQQMIMMRALFQMLSTTTTPRIEIARGR